LAKKIKRTKAVPKKNNDNNKPRERGFLVQ
jgi:hypothetical protein